MNIFGPLPASALTIPHARELDLHPFQRVTGQILSITGSTALLTIEGYPVVAQLASAEQAANFRPQQTAHFIVTGRTPEALTLKLVAEDIQQAGISRSISYGPEVAVSLLHQQALPITSDHLVIARALLRQHLPVTSLLVSEIQGALAGLGSWGLNEAEAAAALKAKGLPLSPESLALASRQAAQIGNSLTRLLTKLTDLTGQDIPEALLRDIESGLGLLDTMLLKSDGQASQLAEQLKQAVMLMGRSTENILLERAKHPGELSIEKDLLLLIQLQQRLEQTGEHELAAALRDFLKDLQQSQFLNARPEGAANVDEWAELHFGVQNAQGRDSEMSSARLRTARENRDGESRINPAYTRLILQVDLDAGQTVEVDLSIADHQIRTSVTAPDALWCQQARDELPTLEEAFRALGFSLKDTQFEVGQPAPFERLGTSPDVPLTSVDIEV